MWRELQDIRMEKKYSRIDQVIGGLLKKNVKTKTKK